MNVNSGAPSPQNSHFQSNAQFHPPPPRPLLRAHLLVAVALLMLYLSQNRAWSRDKFLNRVFESTNYTHENTGAGHIFLSTNNKCESIPKPPYLS
jgi:hypothetical protein